MILDALLSRTFAAPDPVGTDVLSLSLLDWAACGLAGQGEPVSTMIRAYTRADSSDVAQGKACVFGGGQTRPDLAALANGTIAHALDYDDTHFDHIGHTSVVVVSAALAMAQDRGADFSAFRDAALAGSEVAIAMGTWLGRAHYQAGFHQTATSGAFGAAAACGRLLALSPDQMGHAFGLVATRAAGLKAQFGTMGKPYNAGQAAHAGLEAATLAGLGMTSTAVALQAFADTHAGAGADLPHTPRFHAVSHKLHACCHGLHAALEAQATLGAPASPTSVTTHPRWMSVCNQPSPTTGLGAKFSYRTALALAALGHNTAKLDTFSDALATDPNVIALRDQITVETDDTLPETAARVTAKGLTASHDLAAPQPFATRKARVTEKARALIGAKADQIQAAIDAEDLTAFTQALK